MAATRRSHLVAVLCVVALKESVFLGPLRTAHRRTAMPGEGHRPLRGLQALGPLELSKPELELWFVRHGESKNNAILNAAGGLGAVMYPLRYQQDPHITEKGVQVARANGQRLFAANARFDLVLSSAMVRTMETAYYMFVEANLIEQVHVVPYISEVPLVWKGVPIYENMPLKREEQIKILGRRHGSALLDKLDFTLVGGSSGDNEETLPPNGDMFLQWLYKQDIIHHLIAARKAGEDSEPIRIGVVTHSHLLMKEDMLHLDKRPSNADVWIAKLHVMETDTKPVLALTDLTGWFQEAVEQERERVEKHIGKTEAKAMKKKNKYEQKIEKLQAKLVKSDRDAQDFEKVAEKEASYQQKMNRKEAKYGERVEKLQEQKSKLINLSDSQAEVQRKNLASKSSDGISSES